MNTCAPLSTLLLTALLGCASEVPSQPAAPPAVIPAQLPATLSSAQFLAYQASVECAAMFSCAAQPSTAALRIYLGDYARCAARLDLLPDAPQRRRLAGLVAAGRLRFDEAAARRCLEAERASVCAAPADCAAAYAGVTPTGMPCVDRRECAGDAYCSFRTAEGNFGCPGRCAARLPVGSQCFGDSDACSAAASPDHVDCAYDPSRSGSPWPFVCRDRASITVAQGGECANNGDGTAPQRTCAAGLDCTYVSETTGVTSRCTPPAPAGETCSRYCQPGSVCEFDGTRFMQRCLPFTVRNAEGETCVQGNNGGEVCNVLLGLDCVAGHCRRVGTGAENSVCFTGRYGVTSCNPGLYCNAATMTCQRRKADGAACRTDDECQSLACENDSAGQATCVATPSGC
ncbi:MAG: hypothetical protein U0326_43100 [Polyangiales bacterium]